MSIKQRIEQDLKSSMLAGDKVLTTTLRGLKSAILNVEVAKNARESGLSEEEVVSVLQKEAKKRQESAELYKKGGNEERAQSELDEKAVIEKYLPAQLSDDELRGMVEASVEKTGATEVKDTGKVIAEVKSQVGNKADGGRIAVMVKERLSS